MIGHLGCAICLHSWSGIRRRRAGAATTWSHCRATSASDSCLRRCRARQYSRHCGVGPDCLATRCRDAVHSQGARQLRMADHSSIAQPLQCEMEPMRCSVRSFSPPVRGDGGIGAYCRSITPVAAEDLPSRLGRRECRLGSLADELALLLRHRRVDPEHQIVRPRHVRHPERDAILRQLPRVSRSLRTRLHTQPRRCGLILASLSVGSVSEPWFRARPPHQPRAPYRRAWPMSASSARPGGIRPARGRIPGCGRRLPAGSPYRSRRTRGNMGSSHRLSPAPQRPASPRATR